MFVEMEGIGFLSKNQVSPELVQLLVLIIVIIDNRGWSRLFRLTDRNCVFPSLFSS